MSAEGLDPQFRHLSWQRPESESVSFQMLGFNTSVQNEVKVRDILQRQALFPGRCSGITRNFWVVFVWFPCLHIMPLFEVQFKLRLITPKLATAQK